MAYPNKYLKSYYIYVFGLKEGKREEIKLRKPINKLGLTFIDFRNFFPPCFYPNQTHHP
jgi:hypothetical protein